MSFYIGQKVVCIGSDPMRCNNFSTWEKVVFLATGKRPKGHGPGRGDVIRISGIGDSAWGPVLQFIEYSPMDWYGAHAFRPIDALEEQLERIESSPKVEPEPQHA